MRRRGTDPKRFTPPTVANWSRITRGLRRNDPRAYSPHPWEISRRGDNRLQNTFVSKRAASLQGSRNFSGSTGVRTPLSHARQRRLLPHVAIPRHPPDSLRPSHSISTVPQPLQKSLCTRSRWVRCPTDSVEKVCTVRVWTGWPALVEKTLRGTTKELKESVCSTPGPSTEVTCPDSSP